MKEKYSDFSLLEFYNLTKTGTDEISIKEDKTLKKEEYKIRIGKEGICIFASSDEGKYRALTSLLQMIKTQNGVISFCDIHDWPELSHRGYMLDISRCRMPKLCELKNIIDYISGLKYNEFQLYFEGHCFKYKSFPEYTESFDCLTEADIRELNAYCKERFIDFIPNQNSLGHLYQWLSKPELLKLSLSENNEASGTINPLLPESLEFIDKLYSDVLPCYTSEYVNIGLDEALALGKYQSEEYCKEFGKDKLFMEWLNKTAKLAEKYGKTKVMFWADMIYKFERTYDMIPKGAVLLEWGYELIQSQRMTEHCIKFKNAGLNYYVCPSCNTHMSFTGRADVTNYNIRTACEIASEQNANGMLLADWGNGDGHPHFWVWSAQPIAFAAQCSWNIGEEQNGENFKADFIRSAEDYVDNVIFNGVKVSRLLYRMANYYLLEPERIHCGTMCGQLIQLPITKTGFNNLFDLKNSGDVFYFDNVICYVNKVLKDIKAKDFDSRLKREIILNAQMVILSAEICKLRIKAPLSKEKAEELVALIDHIAKEYHELWCFRNFEKGVENFENQLEDRRKDILALVK